MWLYLLCSKCHGVPELQRLDRRAPFYCQKTSESLCSLWAGWWLLVGLVYMIPWFGFLWVLSFPIQNWHLNVCTKLWRNRCEVSIQVKCTAVMFTQILEPQHGRVILRTLRSLTEHLAHVWRNMQCWLSFSFNLATKLDLFVNFCCWCIPACRCLQPLSEKASLAPDGDGTLCCGFAARRT